MKILVFLDDPSSAHEVVRSVGQMALGYGNEFEVHLSRMLNFASSKARPHSTREAVGAGVGPAAPESPPFSAEKTSASDFDAANEYLARLTHRYLAGVSTKRVVFGHTPAAEINTYAKREGIDLIAVSDRGNRSLRQMLLFSGRIPLLTVPCGQAGK